MTAAMIVGVGYNGSGGEIVAASTPENVLKEKRSYTGQYLKAVLAKGGPKRRKVEAAE